MHIGAKRTLPIKIRVFDYDQEQFTEHTFDEWKACSAYAQTNSVTWIDVDGIHNADVIEGLGEMFGVHILVLEDIMNSQSRPKVEFFESYTFMTLKMLDFSASGRLSSEQFSLLMAKNFLITFQERPGDSFDDIRQRIRTSKGRVRSKDGYYLAYLLLDVVIDNYITVSDGYGRQLEELETLVLARPNENAVQRILAMRKELLNFKRSIDPLKEAINLIHKELDDGTGKYYRDLYDHIVYESENLSMYREMIVNLLDLHHSSLTYKTNHVMRVLTIITTIFVPLTFLVGVYGMNFQNMPETKWEYGYFYVLGVMAVTVVLMVIYFKRKKWL